MKKFNLMAVLLVLFGASTIAQTNITLNINHQLGGEELTFNTTSTNNLGDDFEIERLEYYLSRFTLVHDGGSETSVNDVWALVQGDETYSIELGSHDINSIESIRFHVGVGQDVNHEDPSAYDSDHPLAPQMPSMHWGWTSGYRFMAIEGNGGSNLNELYELHGLGDDNYFETTVVITANAESEEIVLELEADCNRILEDIGLDMGLIVHGDYGEAQRTLENMRDYVFSASANTVGTSFANAQVKTLLFPNPSIDGVFTLKLDDISGQTFQIEIKNILGQTIFAKSGFTSNQKFTYQLNTAGIYFVNLRQGNSVVSSQKLIVQ